MAINGRKPQDLRGRDISGIGSGKFVKFGLSRLDKFRRCYRKRLLQDLGELHREHDRNRARIAGVNRNWKSTGITVVSVDRAVSFPNAIGVAGELIIKADQKNLGPEIGIELMLCLNNGEIVACRNNATVQNNEIVLGGTQDDALLAR